jgi:signal transduction histidine kinase
MMERAEIIGGKLYLDSALKQGTSVTIEIPYSEYAPES